MFKEWQMTDARLVYWKFMHIACSHFNLKNSFKFIVSNESFKMQKNFLEERASSISISSPLKNWTFVSIFP